MHATLIRQFLHRDLMWLCLPVSVYRNSFTLRGDLSMAILYTHGSITFFGIPSLLPWLAATPLILTECCFVFTITAYRTAYLFYQFGNFPKLEKITAMKSVNQFYTWWTPQWTFKEFDEFSKSGIIWKT